MPLTLDAVPFKVYLLVYLMKLLQLLKLVYLQMKKIKVKTGNNYSVNSKKLNKVKTKKPKNVALIFMERVK
jgi:hypothetical protein